MLLALDPAGYDYRPLKERMTGHDVVALQFALGGLVPDGDFGPKTAARVLAFQKANFTDPDDHDSIAGIKTQRAATLKRTWTPQGIYDTPPGLARGMVEGESGFQVGNHTPIYARNGKMDVGVVMFHVDPHDQDAVLRALNVPAAIERLLGDPDRGMRPRHDRYYGMPGAPTHQWAWWLAVMSWNAPSWADTWAQKGSAAMTPAQREWMLDYLSKKIVYVKDWSDPRDPGA
jgi:peptidoglycan hydrolase-like protein with peptidoglycan-binding domain